MLFDLALSFLTAIALGGLIGAEREMLELRRVAQKKGITSFGGIRTHILLSILGALSGYFYTSTQFVFLSYGLMIFTIGVLTIYYAYKSFHTGNPGLTSTVSGLITFAVGGLTTMGQASLAVMLAVITTIILVSKLYFKRILESVEQEELYNTLKFAVVLFVILPILPNTPLDPWGILNPQEIWYVVVLISGISYVGYIATKIIGTNRGIILSGTLGGLASSTAVTSSMSEQSKKNISIVFPFVIATIVASSMMFFRVLFWVYSFNQSLVPTVLIPILSMGITSGLIVGIYFLIEKRKDGTKHIPSAAEKLRSPFEILPAVKFAIFFIFISLVSTGALFFLGEKGTYLVSFVSGFADVDAITVSLSRQALEGVLTNAVAAKGIIIAMMTNTFVKLMLAKLFGGKSFGNHILFSFITILIVGGFSLFFV